MVSSAAVDLGLCTVLHCMRETQCRTMWCKSQPTTKQENPQKMRVWPRSTGNHDLQNASETWAETLLPRAHGKWLQELAKVTAERGPAGTRLAGQ